MEKLLKNVRFYVLVFTGLLALGISAFVFATIPSGTLQTIRLTQYFALTAVFYLYLSLLAGPLCFTFRFLPFRGVFMKARRAIGVSACFFALLHASFAFFGQLGGFAGLLFLNNRYLLAISLSFTALIILCAMAITSSKYAIQRLTLVRWKLLHRLVYIAGFLIVFHALMLGTHFQDLWEPIPQIFFIVLAILLVFESLRIDAWVRQKFVFIPRYSVFVILSIGIIGGFYFYLDTNEQTVSIHYSQPMATSGHSNRLPATKDSNRFTTIVEVPETVVPEKSVNLSIMISDLEKKIPVILFATPYEKPMHVVIVDESLAYFDHVHPEQNGEKFNLIYTFPKNGNYRLYVDYQPFDSYEQLFSTLIPVGPTQVREPVVLDRKFTKKFADLEISLTPTRKVSANKLSSGRQRFEFTLKDVQTRKPITNLEPYLGAFGHLVMIKNETYEYIHIHPLITVAATQGQAGGPSVAFAPMNLYKPITPGVYRLFGQFKYNGKIVTADYTIEVGK